MKSNIMQYVFRYFVLGLLLIILHLPNAVGNSICRLKAIEGLQHLGVEGEKIVGSNKHDVDSMKVYITLKDNRGLYLHSNFVTTGYTFPTKLSINDYSYSLNLDDLVFPLVFIQKKGYRSYDASFGEQKNLRFVMQHNIQFIFNSSILKNHHRLRQLGFTKAEGVFKHKWINPQNISFTDSNSPPLSLSEINKLIPRKGTYDLRYPQSYQHQFQNSAPPSNTEIHNMLSIIMEPQNGVENVKFFTRGNKQAKDEHAHNNHYRTDSGNPNIINVVPPSEITSSLKRTRANSQLGAVMITDDGSQNNTNTQTKEYPSNMIGGAIVIGTINTEVYDRQRHTDNQPDTYIRLRWLDSSPGTIQDFLIPVIFIPFPELQKCLDEQNDWIRRLLWITPNNKCLQFKVLEKSLFAVL